MYYKKDSILF